MRKNTATLIIAIIAAVVLLLNIIPREETAGLLSQPEEASLPAAEAWELLREAKEQVEVEALQGLAKRWDAMGYAANLALAELEQESRERYLRQALKLYDDSNVRLLLAEHLAGTDKDDEAIMMHLGLLPADEAVAALHKLGLEQEEILKELQSQRQWQAMLDFLAQRETDSIAEKKYLAEALVGLGRFDEAEPLLADLINLFGENDTVTWNYARSLEALGQTEAAMELYQELGEAGGQRLGRLYEQEGETARAARAYSKSKEPAALWRGAVLWDELGDKKEALALYQQLTQEPGTYQDDAFYRSYVLLQEQDSAEADAMLAGLDGHPVWMQRLNKEADWPQLQSGEEYHSGLLERLEIYQSAEREDLLQIELAIAWERASAEEMIAIGLWFVNRENYRQASRWGIGALRQQPQSREAYELAYPRPFKQAVTDAAQEFDLEPELIWAVMREESRFQPAVASPAGAWGLLQIMPATGEEIATNLGLDFTRDMLTEVDINIRFGAYYLRAMLNRYDNDLDKALAAYNGGPGNVNRWQSSQLGSSATGFPTAVSFLETRQYITKVQETYLTYQWLYSE